MSLSAVIICHQDRDGLLGFLERLKDQTKPPDELIVCVCCMDLDSIEADIVLKSPHKEDWGAEKCEQGLKLASCDYVWYCNCDDEPDNSFIEKLTAEDADIIASDFSSRHAGEHVDVRPMLGQITRGCFIVKREAALRVGYSDRTYNADGIHAEALAGNFKRIPELLYKHN